MLIIVGNIHDSYMLRSHPRKMTMMLMKTSASGDRDRLNSPLLAPWSLSSNTKSL